MTKLNIEQNNITLSVNHLVNKQGASLTTTSLLVAEAFDKRHKNILQTIENIECSEEFNRLNFQPVKYKAGNGEMRPSYKISQEGFMMLVMGFTGKKAIAWKENFISAFETLRLRDQQVNSKAMHLLQQQVIDQANELADINKLKLAELEKRTTRLFSVDEVIKMKSLKEEGYNNPQIAAILGRTLSSVRQKFYHLKKKA